MKLWLLKLLEYMNTGIHFLGGSFRSISCWAVIFMTSENLFCRLCGYKHESAPWGTDGKSPDYAFCPCCGVEAGYGDCTAQAARKWRQEWLAKGANWDDPKEKPANWNAKEQLKNVPAPFQ